MKRRGLRLCPAGLVAGWSGLNPERTESGWSIMRLGLEATRTELGAMGLGLNSTLPGLADACPGLIWV